MTLDTESLRRLDTQLEERSDLLCETARRLPAVTPNERDELLSRVLDFLHEEIVEHMSTEEQLLYPKIAERLGDPLAAAPMNYEHRAMRWWIDRIAQADITDVDELQRLLYGLHALIKVHLSREEDLYADALDAAVWPS
jgi:hemerythrin-like domain-containing protein